MVNRPFFKRSSDSNASGELVVASADQGAREIVEAERVERPEVFRESVNDMLRQAPPKIPQPVQFLQRMTFETDLLTTLYQIKSTYIAWGYKFAYSWSEYYWFYYVARLFLAFLSSQSREKPSLTDQWTARETRTPFLDRPLKMMEMALEEANKLGLTLRAKAQSFRPLPRERMLSYIDPNFRDLPEPETIGVLQLAHIIATSARKRRDCFVVVDTGAESDLTYGAGKSQLAIEVAGEAYAALGKAFDLRRDVVYSSDRKRFNRLLSDRSPEQPFVVDELDTFIYGRESMKGENKEIVQTLKRTRKWGRPIVGCSGSIWGLDVVVRELKVTHRCRIEGWDEDRFTGRATVWRKGGFPKQDDDYWGKFLFSLEFEGLPKDAFDKYTQCVLMTEETNDLDKFLSKNPEWLVEPPNTPLVQSTDASPKTPDPAP